MTAVAFLVVEIEDAGNAVGKDALGNFLWRKELGALVRPFENRTSPAPAVRLDHEDGGSLVDVKLFGQRVGIFRGPGKLDFDVGCKQFFDWTGFKPLGFKPPGQPLLFLFFVIGKIHEQVGSGSLL